MGGYDCLEEVKGIGFLRGEFEGAFYDVERKRLAVKADRSGHALLGARVRGQMRDDVISARVMIAGWEGEKGEMSLDCDTLRHVVVVECRPTIPFSKKGKREEDGALAGIDVEGRVSLYEKGGWAELDINLEHLGGEYRSMIVVKVGKWNELVSGYPQKKEGFRFGVLVEGVLSSGRSFSELVVREDGNPVVFGKDLADESWSSSIGDVDKKGFRTGRFAYGEIMMEFFLVCLLGSEDDPFPDGGEGGEELRDGLGDLRRIKGAELEGMKVDGMIGPIVDTGELFERQGLTIHEGGYVVFDETSKVFWAKLMAEQMELLEGLFLTTGPDPPVRRMLDLEWRVGGEEENRDLGKAFSLAVTSCVPAEVDFAGAEMSLTYAVDQLDLFGIEVNFGEGHPRLRSLVEKDRWVVFFEEFRDGEWRELRVRVRELGQ